MYLVPPMADDPPPAFVAFTAAHQAEVTSALGSRALTDVAAHWRRLTLWSRLTGTDAPTAYLRHRLARRAEQQHEATDNPTASWASDLRLLPPQPAPAPVRREPSLALRRAPLLPRTTRPAASPAADAGIAWVNASRREQWHRLARLAATIVVLVGGLIQGMWWLASPPS